MLVTKLNLRVLPYRGGEYNAAMARVVLAVALWLTIDAHTHSPWSYVMESTGFVWHAKGLVKLLFPLKPPSEAFFVGLEYLARASCLLMAVGLLTRLSQAVCAIATTFIVSLHWSPYVYWSHGANVTLLASLVFMFCRSGDRMSLDYLIRKCLSGDAATLSRYEGNYWLPVLAAELAVHLFMLGAFWSKWTNVDGIWWALSDNLRNSLAIAWGLYRFEAPALVPLTISSPLLYKSLGVLQLFTQLTTSLAVLMIHRPVLRLLFGGVFFFLEIIGLTVLFEFWHAPWVALCLLSVDWEWLWGQARAGFPFLRPPAGDGPRGTVGRLLAPVRAVGRVLLARRELELSPNPETARIEIEPRLLSVRQYGVAFYAAFVAYYVASFVLQLSESHLNYPFSSMAFYSANRDRQPYSVPKWYVIYRGWLEVADSSDGHLALTVLPTDQTERLRGLLATEALMRETHARLRTRFSRNEWPRYEAGGTVARRPVGSLQIIRTYTQIVGVPPHPEPALPLQVLHSGLLSVEDGQGFRGVAPRLEWDAAVAAYKLHVGTWGFRQPTIEILARWDVREQPGPREPQPLPGEWRDGVFWVTNTRGSDARFIYSLIKVTDAALGVEETYAGPENFQAYR